MFEAMITQELEFPTSNLLQYEERVPLPKFIELPDLPYAPPSTSNNQEEDAFCHYHFLAQIAHRIILSRLRDSLFSRRRGNSAMAAHVMPTARNEYPSQSLEDELLHQLEQWRQQLPMALQFDDERLVPLPNSPANIIVVPWLRARYLIARYHLRRPLLYVDFYSIFLVRLISSLGIELYIIRNQ